jgi:hypothetical protein
MAPDFSSLSPFECFVLLSILMIHAKEFMLLLHTQGKWDIIPKARSNITYSIL